MTHAQFHTREMELFGISAEDFDEIGVSGAIARLALLKGAGQAPPAEGGEPPAEGEGGEPTLAGAIAARSAAEAQQLEAQAAERNLIDLGNGFFMDAVTREVLQPRFINDVEGSRVEFRPSTDITTVRRALGIDPDPEDDRATAISAGNLAARRAELGEEMRQFDIDAAQADDELAQDLLIEQANLDFLDRKLAIDEEDGRRDDARNTSQLIASTRIAITEINQNRATLVSQATARNADRIARTAEVNAQLALQTSQENARRTEENRRAQLDVATQVAEFTGDPGSATKLASFLGTNIAEGALGTALAGGEDFRTAESTAPLVTARGQQRTLEQGPKLLDFTPLTPSQEAIPQFEPLDPEAFLNAIFQSMQAEQGGGPVVDSTFADETDVSAVETQLAERGATTAQLPEFVQRNLGLPTVEAQEGFNGIVREPTNLIVGEGGEPEQVSVTPLDGPQSAVDPQAIDPSDPIGFLNAIAAGVAEGSPFEDRGFALPVEVSAPGTDPGFRRFAAGLTSTARGVNPETFLNRVARLTPLALRLGILRRSA